MREDFSMKINLYHPESNEPEIFDIPTVATVGEAIAGVAVDGFQDRILDSSGIRRFVSAYLGVPRQGVRNVKLEGGTEAAIKNGEELTLLIAEPRY